MSTYVYMRILESAPRRYDLGIRLLSCGRVEELYDLTADAAVSGLQEPHVLEIGCGTGNLTLALAKRGARVSAVDQNPEMLQIARGKLDGIEGVELREMTASEVADRFTAESFDVVTASLVLSEMSPEEQLYVLRGARKLLRDGGRLVMADETQPHRFPARLLHAVLRLPVAVLAYVLTQTSTRAVADPSGLLRAAGFELSSEQRSGFGSMTVVVGLKTPDARR